MCNSKRMTASTVCLCLKGGRGTVVDLKGFDLEPMSFTLNVNDLLQILQFSVGVIAKPMESSI